MQQIKDLAKQYLPLIRNPGFLKVLLAGFISQVGSKISYFALLRKVYTISGGSITDLGFLAIMEMVPGMLLAPFAGVLIDRTSRKAVMIVCDLVNAVIILGLVFTHDLVFIYVVACLSSLVTTFRYPAQQALEPNLVEQDEIVLLNSFKASSNSTIMVIGSAVGGATVGLLGVKNAFIIDSLTFLLSAVIIFSLVVKENHLIEAKGIRSCKHVSQWYLFKEGLAVLAQNISVRMVLLVQIFLTFAMSMQGMLIYYFLKETLKLGDFAEPFWGYLLAALGLGGMIGSFFIGVIIKNYKNRFTLFLNILLGDAVVFAMFLLTTHLPLSLILFSILGVSGVAHQIVVNSILQEQVDDSHRGRVFSILGILVGPVSALSIFLGTTAALYTTARNVLLLAAVCEALIAVGLRFTALYKAINLADSPRPHCEKAKQLS